MRRALAGIAAAILGMPRPVVPVQLLRPMPKDPGTGKRHTPAATGPVQPHQGKRERERRMRRAQREGSPTARGSGNA